MVDTIVAAVLISVSCPTAKEHANDGTCIPSRKHSRYETPHMQVGADLITTVSPLGLCDGSMKSVVSIESPGKCAMVVSGTSDALERICIRP